MADASDRGTIVELEFALHDTDFFLVEASNTAECNIELESMVQRSDGTVLEFFSVRGADPDRLLDLAQESPEIHEARLITETEDEALIEFVSGTDMAKALADNETVFQQISATAGEGWITAEVPPHIDAKTVIDSFLEEYPGSELVARRETDRTVPTLTHAQLRDDLVREFTDKQLEALRVAHANGYFAWPRDRRAEDIADVLDVAPSTFSQHLRAAERKLLDAFFDE